MKKTLFSAYSSSIIIAAVILFIPTFVHADDLPTDVTSTDDIVTSTPSEEIPAPTATLHIRYLDQFVYEGTLPIPTSTTFTYHDSGSDETLTTTTPQSTVLALLATADSMSDAFNVSDLAYYPSFGSMLLNCIGFGETEACYNWNYIVNNSYPFVGMDQTTLSGDEHIYIYFSNPWLIAVSSSTLPVGATTTIATTRYQYDNLATPEAPDPHDLVSISIINPNPTGWWDATLTIDTTTTDDNGLLDYAFTATGTYYLQITSLDYSKFSSAVMVTVTDAPATTTPPETPVEPPTGGTGCTDCILPTDHSHDPMNITQAVQFLTNLQTTNGAIGSVYLSDWAAIGLGSIDRTSTVAAALKNYLLTNTSPRVTDSPATDDTRRAMALMALGVSPYNGTPTNYIDAIVSHFDGTQFGSIDLVNDDIFALIPLLSSGYTANDAMIASTTAFIVQGQNPDGSWVGTDITAAAVQALSLVQSLPGVPDALTHAKTFLHSRQQTDGSFDHNVFTTAWVMQAITSFHEPINSWLQNNLSAHDYLRASQSTDGGLIPTDSVSNRIWATSYAIAGASEKSWPTILGSFTRPTTGQNQTTSGSGTGAGTTTITTTSTTPIQTTTTTPPFVSSTILTTTTTVLIATTTVDIIIPTILTLPTPPTPPTAAQTTAVLRTTSVTTQATDEQIEQERVTASDKNTESEAATTTPSETTPETTLSVTPPTVTPINKTTRGVFAGAATLAGTMGLYLGWRLLRTLV